MVVQAVNSIERPEGRLRLSLKMSGMLAGALVYERAGETAVRVFLAGGAHFDVVGERADPTIAAGEAAAAVLAHVRSLR
jgi:hypothetical protein